MNTIFHDGYVFLIDKPLGWTSFDVVRKIRNAAKVKKTGHAGTLDPLATGLLIICTGRFTKKINEYMAQVKEYTGTFTLGAVTPTYDLESEPIEHKPYDHLTTEQLKNIAVSLTGEISQVPPIHSALKVDGKRGYELARKGIEVEMKPRNITVFEFEITAINLPEVSFRIVCSTGTYIRSIANDFGKAAGCGAYLSKLVRTKIGEHSLENAMNINEALDFIKETVS